MANKISYRRKITLKETIIKELPKLLQEDENFKREFIQIFSPYFAEKEKTEDRFNILLEEIRNLRKESEERWEEHKRVLEEHSKILKEHSKILKEHSEILEEHSKKLEFLTQELIALRKRQDVQIGALGARWGIKSERSFRNALKGLLEESFPVRVERYETTDLEGEVFEGHPGSKIEFDLIIRDGEIIVAELKSSISAADVLLFEKKVKFFEKKEGKKVSKKIIISPMIDPLALEFCKKLGITAYTDVPYPDEEL